MRDLLEHLIHGVLVGLTAYQDNRYSMAFDQYIDETCKRRGRPLLDRISCSWVNTDQIAVQECLIGSPFYGEARLTANGLGISVGQAMQWER